MNTNDVIERLASFGLTGMVRETGHPDFTRIFVLSSAATIGRITIHKGEYSHVKWYVEGAHFRGPLTEDECIAARWNFLERCGVLLTNEQIRAAEQVALEEAKNRIRKKLAWREQNPHPKGKHGRKRIPPPDARGLLGKYLISLYQPKETPPCPPTESPPLP